MSGQKRGVGRSIKRQLRRRAADEPVIGYLKAEHRMGRNYLGPDAAMCERHAGGCRLQLPAPDRLA